MRTIIWFIYFWLYLLCTVFALNKVRRLTKQGKIKEHDEKVRFHVNNWAGRLLRLAGAKITVEGRENIPQGPCVFAANHQGYFDIPLMLTQLDEPHPLVAKKEIQKLPLIRSWMKELNCLFIDRENPRQAMECLKKAGELLEQGYSVVIFPEGTRSKGGPIGEFKAGTIRVATKAKAPIVPVRIEGTYISDTNGFEHAQVCAGGVRLTEINASTMESLRCGGLYLAGEILDADGICGGYNLQWAWTTGYLAGLSAVSDEGRL